MFDFLYEIQKIFMKIFRNKQIFLLFVVVLFIVIYFGVDFVRDYQFNDVVDDTTIIEESKNNWYEIEDKEMKVNDDIVKNEKIEKDENNETETEINVNTTINEDKNINEKNKIFVYVTGEVNTVGVVTLDEGSRISDAINAAGGVTNAANISKINLVYVLEDGMKVNIPNDNDLKNNPDFEYITIGSGDGDDNSNIIFSNKNNYDTGNLDMGSNIDIVNINIATQTELETLPGIGPSLALKIIKYRNENGKFLNIEDIKNVSGIGESKFKDIRNYISI